jgi:hypothetical protein
LFYRVTKCVAGVPIAYKKNGLKHNNNSWLKGRLKVMRGSFRSWEGIDYCGLLNRWQGDSAKSSVGLNYETEIKNNNAKDIICK